MDILFKWRDSWSWIPRGDGGGGGGGGGGDDAGFQGPNPDGSAGYGIADSGYGGFGEDGLSGQAAAEASVGLDAFGGIGADVGTSSGSAGFGIGYGAGDVDPGLASAAGIGTGSGVSDSGSDFGGFDADMGFQGPNPDGSAGYGIADSGYGGFDADVGLDAFGGIGDDVGGLDADVGLDAFGGSGPDVGVSSGIGEKGGGLDADMDTGRATGFGVGTPTTDNAINQAAAAAIAPTDRLGTGTVTAVNAGTFSDAFGNVYGTEVDANIADTLAESQATGANTQMGLDPVSADPLGTGTVTPVDASTSFDAFGNTYGTEVEASIADSIAQAEAAVAAIGLDQAPDPVSAPAETFSDAFGNQYGTQAEAAEADSIAEGLNASAVESLGLSFSDAFGNQYGTQAKAAAADAAAEGLSAISTLDENTVMSQAVPRGYAVGDRMTTDVMDILGDPTGKNVGDPMTVEDIDALSSIVDRMNIEDVTVVDDPYSVPEEDLASAINLSDEGTVFATTSATTTASTAVAPTTPASTQAQIDAAIASLQDQVAPTALENIATNVLGTLASVMTGLPVGGLLGKQAQNMSIEARQELAESHIAALNKGATAVMDDDGNYIGFDTSTMSSFADEALADIDSVMPGAPMSEEDFGSFQNQFGLQEEAAEQDPYGGSTEIGFVTEDGRGFYANENGTVSEIDNDVVDFDRGGGQSVDSVFGGGFEGGEGDLNPCEPGFAFDPVEGICMPVAADGGSEESSSDLSLGDRPFQPRPAPAPTPTPPPSNVEGLKVTKPKQFAMGGAVTPNIDRFIGSLR